MAERTLASDLPRADGRMWAAIGSRPDEHGREPTLPHAIAERTDAAVTAVVRPLVRWGAHAAGGLGVAVILAWVVGAEPIVRVRADWPVTTPLTAFVLVLAALGVELRRRGGPGGRRGGRVLGVGVTALGAIGISVHLGFLRPPASLWAALPNVDAWQPDVAYPGLSPLMTGCIVLAIGHAIAAGDIGPRWLRLGGHVGVLASWVVLGVVLLRYVGGETGGLRWEAPPDVALPAAVGLALLWFSLAPLTFDAGLLARFGRSPTARLLVRQLGPVLLLVPLLPRGVGRLTEQLGVGPGTAAALADLSVVVLLAAALVVVGLIVDGLQSERARSAALLQGVLGALHEGLIVRDADDHLVVANPAADQMVGLRFSEDPDRATMIAAGGLRDDGGMPLTVDELPSTHVRRTGEPVLGRVFRLGADAEQPLWVRANCVPYADEDGRLGTISTFNDVTFDHELSTALALAEERFRLAFEQAPIGIGVVLPDGSYEDANPALCAVLDRPRDEVLQMTFRELTHPDDLDADLTLMEDLTAGRIDSFQLDKRYLRPDGEPVWVSLHVSALRDHDGVPRRFLAQVVDLTERKLLELQLAHAATHDPLTGLPNRRLVEDRLAVALAAAERDGTSVAVLFCDLDGFKAVNDTHGHRTGDLVLTEISRRLLGVGRNVDTVGRLGGDEFVVVAGGITDPGDAERLATRVRQVVEEPITLDGLVVRPRVSVGLHIADGAATADQAFSAADGRMYERKTARREADLTAAG